MAKADNFQLVEERGWRRGFANLFRKESGEWWRTSRWWKQILIMLIIINGIMAIGLWLVPIVDPTDPGIEGGNLLVFAQLMSNMPMFAVIVITQGAIIGEKQSGTAAWVLSAPVSRTGFILSQFLANAIGFLVTIIIVQGLVAYAQISLSEGSPPPIGLFLAMLSLLSLYLIFYLALTLMLGTFFGSRGPVLGIALGVSIGSLMGIGSLFGRFLPELRFIFPDILPALISAIAQGETLPSVWPIPIIVMTVYIVLFGAMAIRRFNREEF